MQPKCESFSIVESSTVGDAVEAINNSGLGVCIIVDHVGRFVNLLTDGDVRRGLMGGITLEEHVMKIKLGEPTIGRSSDSYLDLRRKFSSLVRHLPVLDQEDNVVDLLFFDQRSEIKIANPSLAGNELEYVSDAILSGWISSKGSYIAEFEKKFSDFCGAKFGVSVSNGTVALELALSAAGVGPGAEVIVPSLTFAATANAVLHVGAHPILVDSSPTDWCLCPRQVEDKITPNTKAVIVVHLYGQPAKMEALQRLCKERGLLLIEDAAEAHGAVFGQRRVGSLGDVGCFSFFANKIVTTGEGGMVVTNDESLAERARLLANHGMSSERKYWHDIVGFNFRMSNLQAAIGVAQMERINDFIQMKKKIAEWYFSELESFPMLTCPPRIIGTESVYWCFGVLLSVDHPKTPEGVITDAKSRGVELNPFFPPLHLMPPYPGNKGDFPVAESLSARGFLLPSHPLLTEADQQKVIEVLRRSLTNSG